MRCCINNFRLMRASHPVLVMKPLRKGNLMIDKLATIAVQLFEAIDLRIINLRKHRICTIRIHSIAIKRSNRSVETAGPADPMLHGIGTGIRWRKIASPVAKRNSTPVQFTTIAFKTA